jgi:hypothetical protein
VLGKRVFFAEQFRRDCAGRWLVRIVRLSVKEANLMTRNYVAEGPTAEFVAEPPTPHAGARRPSLRPARGRSRASGLQPEQAPLSGQA